MMRVFFRDSHLVVVEKVAGMTMHDAHDSLLSSLSSQLSCKVFGVHRLDKPASGLVVVALQSRVAEQLVSNWHTARKEYLCLVHDVPPKSEGIINVPIGRRQLGARFDRMAACKDGLPAQTQYVVEQHNGAYSLVRCVLLTGRKHQIRVHLSHIGCPLVGDVKFGSKASTNICLHAQRLEFDHPITLNRMTFESPVPRTFVEHGIKLGLKM
jgi:23S rRNA pseudouridine1911/1915/1917 synthase